MANQFNAALLFVPIEWVAIDKDTGAECTVADMGSCARWWIRIPGDGCRYAGECRRPQGARAAVRRAIARHKKKNDIIAIETVNGDRSPMKKRTFSVVDSMFKSPRKKPRKRVKKKIR